MKMYCIVARDSLNAMGGNRGKLAAQAGHAFLHAYWDSENRFNYHTVNADYRASGKATKVTLVVDTVSELEALRDAYRSVCGVSLVTDAGLTCFGGPTTTCLGIGPIREGDIGQDLRDLRVLI